jgi:hypothetical protein
MQDGITISHAVVLLGTALLSGLVATVITLFWQGKAATQKRKYEIFVDLMSSRFKLDSEKVVYALNMIDVVFHNDNAVRGAYEQFCDEANRPEDGRNSAEDKFLKLLEEIAKVLKLKNITWDRIKKQYYPTALSEMYELERTVLKKQVSDN